MYGAARTLFPFYTVKLIPLKPVHCNEQEGPSNGAASSQQLSASLHDCFNDLLSSVTLFLSFLDEPRIQDTQEEDQGQDGGSSDERNLGNSAGNLRDKLGFGCRKGWPLFGWCYAWEIWKGGDLGL